MPEKTKIEKIIETLKVDGSNPNINKEYLIKILEDLNEASKIKHPTVYEVEDAEEISVEMSSLFLPGDIVNNIDGEAFIVTCTSGPLTLVRVLDDRITTINYVYEGEGWTYSNTASYDLTDITKVKANPTLAGTEAALTGLQVGDTKYKVEGGTKLYKHECYDAQSGSTRHKLVIITTYPNPVSYTYNLVSDGHIVINIASSDTYGGHIPVGFDITSSGLYIVIYDANASDKVSHSTLYSVYDDTVTPL